MITNEKLMADLRKITGWNVDKINEEFSKLKCNYHDAKDVFLATGRLPNEGEQIYLNNFGFEAWFGLHKRGFL